MSKEKAVYTVDELSKVLGVSKGLCYNLVKEGQFRVVRVGRKILIPRIAVDSWLGGGDE